jgi:hypothetical protein
MRSLIKVLFPLPLLPFNIILLARLVLRNMVITGKEPLG